MIGLILVAAALSATPQTLAQTLGKARAGDVVTLAPGHYAKVEIDGQRFDPALVIQAGEAAVAGISITNSAGISWHGGVISAPAAEGPGRAGYAIAILKADSVTIAGTAIGNAQHGIVMGGVSNILIKDNELKAFTIDGIDIGRNSHDVTIDGNRCESFATGKPHPDCIQAWSRAGAPVSDIIVTNNVTRGRLQGIFFGNHPERAGSPDPGFDRVRIEHNIVEVTKPNGIAVYDCRDCILRYNKVSSLPEAPFRVKAHAVRGKALICGNEVADFSQGPASQPCY
jgi:hypothetical protein